MLPSDTFINNTQYRIVQGKNFMGIQHIAKADGNPLCSVRIKNKNIYDLFTNSLLCGRCEEKYNKEINRT